MTKLYALILIGLLAFSVQSQVKIGGGAKIGGTAKVSVVASGGGGATASDDFNRANGGLGSNWTVVYDFGDGVAISSNQVTDTGDAVVAWNGAGTFTDDQYSQVKIVTASGGGSSSQSAAVRVSGSSFGTIKGYFCGSVGTTGVLRYRIFYMNADSDYTVIASESAGTVNVTDGDVIKLSVTFSGGVNTLTCSRNGTNITGLVGITDSTIGTGGKPGFTAHTAADDWSAGAP